MDKKTVFMKFGEFNPTSLSRENFSTERHFTVGNKADGGRIKFVIHNGWNRETRT